MNQKCNVKISKILDTVVDLEDGLNQLVAAIESDDEDRIEPALDALPTPAAVARVLENFREIIDNRPWEDKRKKAKHG